MGNRRICIDLEMTGLSIKRDRVVEFCAIELVDDVITGRELHSLINPDRDIPAKTVRIHGITNEKVAEAPRFPEIAKDIIDFFGNDPIVIFCPEVEYGLTDVSFLNKELELSGFGSILEERFENMFFAVRDLFGRKRASLDLALYKYSIDKSGGKRHGARLDSLLLAEVYPMLRDDYTDYKRHFQPPEPVGDGPMAAMLRKLQHN